MPHQMQSTQGDAVKKEHQMVAQPYVFLTRCKTLKDILPILFSLHDKTSDGKVTLKEWSGQSIQDIFHIFQSLAPGDSSDILLDVPLYNKLAFEIGDGNKDNSLNYLEYINAVDALFDLQGFGQMDQNRDLKIDQGEWNEAATSSGGTPSKVSL